MSYIGMITSYMWAIMRKLYILLLEAGSPISNRIF